MRPGLSHLSVACAFLYAMGGCALAPPELRAPQPDPAATRSAPPADAAWLSARELASWLPPEAERCVLSLPARVDPEHRALIALASPGSALPWRLPVDVEAYARAEFLGAGEHTGAVEYVRVAPPSARALRDALGESDRRAIQWDPEAADCAGELACVPVRAEFVDARTLRIATRHAPPVQSGPEGRCARLLREHPEAVEVSGKRPLGLGERRELTWTDRLLGVSGERVERITRRHFTSPALSARAYRQLLTGGEELPWVAGAPVPVQARRLGEVLELRAVVSLEELSLLRADQESLQAALAPLRNDDAALLREPERVLERVGQRLAALPSGPAARARRLAELDGLLTRARREQPHHEGLARRQYRLRAEQLKDAQAALELADERLAAGAHDVRFWQLARRASLARLDARRLARELARAFGYAPRVAVPMARELVDQVRRGADYERAEWGVTTGQTLFARARPLRMAGTDPVRIPLSHLPRLLAAWARLAAPRAGQDLGVHILAFGPPRAASARTSARGPWSVDTQVAGRPARVLGAASWEEGQLFEQGQALATRFASGRLELVIALDAIDTGARGGVLALAGRVEQGELVLEQVSRPLERVDWARVRRYLAEPLSRLSGSLFPPDELLVEAASEADAELLIAAIEDHGDVRCGLDGLLLRCGGGLGDPRAAYRALLRAARAVLGRDADVPWSSGAP